MANGHGGARKGAGRPKGSRDRATKDHIAGIAEMARMHTQTALDALVQIASRGESEAARVSAATAILDRAYGKPQQSVQHGSDPENPFPAVIQVVGVDADSAG